MNDEHDNAEADRAALEAALLALEAENVYGKPDSCRACTLFQEPGPVFGHGRKDAKIMLLGEAPGAEEVDEPRHHPDLMRPFIGGSGRTLTQLCSHAGIRRCMRKHEGRCDASVETFDTNVVKCRPPGNRTPTPHEIECCSRFLTQELEELNPNVVIALGETPLGALTRRKGIGLWRGVPIEGSGRKVFPTWHPAFIMRAQHNWPFAVNDLVRAHAQAAFPEIRRVPFELIRRADYPSSVDDLRNAIRACGAFTFDFETTGLSPRHDAILMCGFTAGPNKAYVYDWTLGPQQLFSELLTDRSIEVCGQNILNYDLPFAEEKGLKVRWDHVFDTMVAFHLCNSSYGQTSIAEQNRGKFQGARGAEKDLSFIASNHTDIEYWKSRASYKSDLYTVCGTDVIATHRSAYDPTIGIKAELARYDMTSLYYNHVLPVHLPLRLMSKRGVKIDEERATAWGMLLEKNADELEETLKLGLGDPYLNLDSPKQLMDLLYVKLKLPKQFKTDKKGTRLTADAEHLEALAEMAPENEILRSIVTIRTFRKMKSTYIDAGAKYGRLHPRFGVSKAANGRFNSQAPNAQNVPEEMRDIWIPDSPEHVLFSADASQIEWRCAMVLSGDPVGLELLASGADNHRAVASETLGKKQVEITDAERHAAKFIVYGLSYGRGAHSIADGYKGKGKLDLDWVQNFITRFFAKFGTFNQWRGSLVKQVTRDHYLANPFKRRRWWYTHEITEIYNFPPSSTAADMMIEEVIALENQLPKDATLRLTVHDEVVICAAKDVARETRDCIRDVMEMRWPQVVEASARPENVKRFYPNGWYVPVDIGVGTNWTMCKSKDPTIKAERAALMKELGL